MKKFKLLILFVSLFSLNVYAKGDRIQISKSELCYTSRVIPYSYEEVFDVMKRYLISSNFLIKKEDRDGKFMYAEGLIVIKDKGIIFSSNKYYEVKLNLNFQSKILNGVDITPVLIVADYKKVEKNQEAKYVSVGRVSFPIPTPWHKEFRLKDSGNIKDPDFFRAFYYGFYKTLYQEEIDNFGTQKKVEKKKKETNKKTEEGIFE